MCLQHARGVLLLLERPPLGVAAPRRLQLGRRFRPRAHRLGVILLLLLDHLSGRFGACERLHLESRRVCLLARRRRPLRSPPTLPRRRLLAAAAPAGPATAGPTATRPGVVAVCALGAVIAVARPVVSPRAVVRVAVAMMPARPVVRSAVVRVVWGTVVRVVRCTVVRVVRCTVVYVVRSTVVSARPVVRSAVVRVARPMMPARPVVRMAGRMVCTMAAAAAVVAPDSLELRKIGVGVAMPPPLAARPISRHFERPVGVVLAREGRHATHLRVLLRRGVLPVARRAAGVPLQIVAHLRREK